MRDPHSDARRAKLRRFYRTQSFIYDATRWAFLFGRDALLRNAARLATQKGRSVRSLLEVGCGTGRNLAALARLFPEARLTGLDLSPHMLRRARSALRHAEERTTLLEADYLDAPDFSEPFDLILFSYSLSMMHPVQEAILDRARRDLGPGGLLAALDFYDSNFNLYKRYMRTNHVFVDGRLLPFIQKSFEPASLTVRDAPGGLWSYFEFLGG